MRSPLRYDRDAVSAVIATILLVAITVVLAAVLYIMVSGLISPTNNGPQIMGVVVSKTTDGKNWTSIVYKTFSALNWVADGASYTGSGMSIRAGDQLFVDVARFPLNYQVMISASTILYN